MVGTACGSPNVWWVMGRASRRENEPGPEAGSTGLCEIMGIVGARAVEHREAGEASSHLVEGLVWLQQLAGPGAPSVGGSQQLPLGLPRPSPAPRAEAGAGPGARRPYPEGGLRSRWRAGGLCRRAGRWWLSLWVQRFSFLLSRRCLSPMPARLLPGPGPPPDQPPTPD